MASTSLADVYGAFCLVSCTVGLAVGYSVSGYGYGYGYLRPPPIGSFSASFNPDELVWEGRDAPPPLPANHKKGPDVIRFDLFTRREPDIPTRLVAGERDSVVQSLYDPVKPTKVLIHGWLSRQGPGTGGEALKNAFLAVQDCNVITVDWSSLDPKMYYSATRMAVPRAAAAIADLIRMLNGVGARLDDFHLVGHSLGGQIAGEAGRLVLGPARAGRITGLDPAGPLYEIKGTTGRLDPSDAGFVDVVHSNGGLLGYATPTGHVDFYPNGGLYGQPGCSHDSFGVCSHCLVYDIYIDALLRPGGRVYVRCDSWQGYQGGECSSNAVNVMGLNTDFRSRGMFFAKAEVPVRGALLAAAVDFPKLVSKKSARNDVVARLQC